MRYLLNFIYLLLTLAVSPWLLWAAIRHGKYRDGLSAKLLGLVPNLSKADGPRVWIHAVSVGEVNLIATVLNRLRSRVADLEVVISTTTKTGFELASRKYASHTVFYLPLDFSWSVRNAFKRIDPDVLVLVELELWPNLLTSAREGRIPVAIINGRLSDRSARGYRRLGRWVRTWLSGVRLVIAQSQLCAERFVRLGVGAEDVHHVGSLKFDGALTDRGNPKTEQLRRLANIDSDQIVFLAGSTQEPEEAFAIAAWQKLVPEYPNLRLILVPRHPERYGEVRRLLDTSGVSWQARSERNDDSSSCAPVLLVDTVGELGAWWGTADIGFVGGSMGARGGQNMIEPAAYGVATSFGPNTKNFRDVVKMLLAEKAATVVKNQMELETFVRRCVDDADYRAQLGRNAQQLVLQHRGAADRTAELLVPLIAGQRRVSDSKRDRRAA